MLCVYTGLIIRELSWVGILAPILIVLSLYIQGKINDQMERLDTDRRKVVDIRTKRIEEVIVGSRVVKFNAWENVMSKIFKNLRAIEKPKIYRKFCLEGITLSMTSGIPILCGLACFSIYNTIYGQLTLSQTYSLLIYFQLMQNPL